MSYIVDEKKGVMQNLKAKYPGLIGAGMKSMRGIAVAKRDSSTFDEFINAVKTYNGKSTEMINVKDAGQIADLHKFYDTKVIPKKSAKVRASEHQNQDEGVVDTSKEVKQPLEMVTNEHQATKPNEQVIDYDTMQRCIADGTCKGTEMGLEPIKKAISGITDLKDEILKVIKQNNKLIQKNSEVKAMSDEKIIKEEVKAINNESTIKPISDNTIPVPKRNEDRAVLALEAIKKCAIDGVCEGLKGFKEDFKKDVSDMIKENMGRLPVSETINTKVNNISDKLTDFRQAIKNAKDKYDIRKIVQNRDDTELSTGAKQAEQIKPNPISEVLTTDNLEQILSKFVQKISDKKQAKVEQVSIVKHDIVKEDKIETDLKTTKVDTVTSKSKPIDNKKSKDTSYTSGKVSMNDDIRKMVLSILKEENKDHTDVKKVLEPETDIEKVNTVSTIAKEVDQQTKAKLPDNPIEKSPIESNVLYGLVYGNRG